MRCAAKCSSNRKAGRVAVTLGLPRNEVLHCTPAGPGCEDALGYEALNDANVDEQLRVRRAAVRLLDDRQEVEALHGPEPERRDGVGGLGEPLVDFVDCFRFPLELAESVGAGDGVGV